MPCPKPCESCSAESRLEPAKKGEERKILPEPVKKEEEQHGHN